MTTLHHHALFTGCIALVAPLAAQNPTVEQRLDQLEQENRELRQLVAGVASRTDELSVTGGDSSPVSIGGYGEFLFTQRSGRTDEADALRAVLYIGYKFDERWSLSTELEVEHASTGASGEVSLEMASLDYRASDSLDLRAGLLLLPMGIINERHEPTSFLPAQRPETELRILPSTWRELGAGVRGRSSGFEYQAYVVTGLDGEDFGPSGLRGGRQKGSKAASDDFAAVAALRRPLGDALTVGASVYYGKSGQDNLQGTTPIPDLDTSIVEGHAEWTNGPLSARALYASAWIDDAGQFSSATSTTLASRLEGYYVEVGYDVMPLLAPESGARLTPFYRYEHIDTQASMPTGVSPDPRQNDEIHTFGLNIQPIDKVVIKLDYAAWDHDFDRFTVGMGYVF